MPRSMLKRRYQSMADDFDIIIGGQTKIGSYGSIQVYNAAFPNDTTSFVVNGAGKNMSALNDVVPDGDITLGHFTVIAVPAGTMVVKAYKQ